MPRHGCIIVLSFNFFLDFFLIFGKYFAGARGDQPGGGEGRGGHHLALLLLRLRGAEAVVAGSPGAHLSEHGRAPGLREQGEQLTVSGSVW